MTAEVFYQKGGVEITEAMFKTPDGTNYPVRNLSSVKTTTGQKTWLLVVSILLLLYGVGLVISDLVEGRPGGIVAGLVLAALGAVAFVAYRGSKRVALVITAGGVERHAIVFPLNDVNVRAINEIKDSLTRALLKVQGTVS